MSKYKVGDEVTQNFHDAGNLLIVQAYVRRNSNGSWVHLTKRIGDKHLREFSDKYFTGIVKKKATKSPLPTWW